MPPCPTVAAEVDGLIDDLPLGKAVDLHTRYRNTLRRIVIRVLFDDAQPGLADEIGDILEPAVRFVDRTVELQSLDPIGRRRARRARSHADEILDAEISRRQAARDLGGDVLGNLLATELSRAEIADQVVSLIAAGYETTSAAIAWTILELLAHPGELERCRTEIESLIGDQVPNPGQLRAMPVITAVINETLRLWPPASLLGRRVSEPVSYGGFTIPAATTLLISPYVSHRSLASWGPDAGEFRPSRWDGHQPSEERFFPFGGAYRHCLGFALALTEIQVGLIRLLQRTTIKSAGPLQLRGHGLSALRPDGGAVAIVESRR
jgi:cytochrome P450